MLSVCLSLRFRPHMALPQARGTMIVDARNNEIVQLSQYSHDITILEL